MLGPSGKSKKFTWDMPLTLCAPNPSSCGELWGLLSFIITIIIMFYIVDFCLLKFDRQLSIYKYIMIDL